jgi:hypothetical protein
MAKKSYYVESEQPIEDLYDHLFNNTTTRIEMYCAEVHYVRSLLQTKFNHPFSLKETYKMLLEEYPDFNYRMTYGQGR